jgi:hypothetical protein
MRDLSSSHHGVSSEKGKLMMNPNIVKATKHAAGAVIRI